jgi:excisionase family DNA binding protein
MNQTPHQIDEFEKAVESASPVNSVFLMLLKDLKKISQKLEDKDIKELKEIAKKYPSIKPTLNLFIFSEENTGSSSKELEDEPDYLTTSDVAEILDISQQMVRKHCKEGKLKAWQTLGNRGEWRIDVEQFRDNPRYKQMIRDRIDRNLRLVDTVRELSKSDEYLKMLDQIDENREKNREWYDE